MEKNQRFFGYDAEWPRLILLFIILTCFVIASLTFGAVSIQAVNGLSYRVKIEGITDNKIRKLLESVSQTFSRRQVPAASMNLLRKRAERDIPRLIKVLKSEGYYAAIVNTQIHEEKGAIRVVFRIDTGPPFLLGFVEIEPVEGHISQKIQWPSLQSMGLFPGVRARSRSIVDGEKILLNSLKTQGYPFPGIETRKVVVDHATHSVAVHFTIDPGPMAYFGPTEITGLESVEIDLLDREGRLLYTILPSAEIPDLRGVIFFEKTIGVISERGENNVYVEYRVENMKEMFD